MIDVVSIKFKNRGKCYFFDPNGLDIKTGDKVIVETSKGLEIADCSRGNHPVEDTAVVQPLRPVVRIATRDDLRVAEINKQREKEAFQICQKKIAEHGLDMKLVDVECNFEGNKTMFFFTSDGRVDFRELVKDLAGIFRNRIELRQIGVRDEAKMIGGLGICGRPYCCNQFLDEFQPVSTKMAKVQSLSLNPAKISGSCVRLMCCLRYEQEAYEDLVKKVPKQGAFVETKDGYGTAVQVNLLRQTVKVKLDNDTDDTLRLFKANELAAVPGGRPKDGETPPSVLKYVPEPEEEETEDEWALPVFVTPEVQPEPVKAEETEKKRSSRNRRNRGAKPKAEQETQKKKEQPKSDRQEGQKKEQPKADRQQLRKQQPRRAEEKKNAQAEKPEGAENKKPRRKSGKATVKPVKVEAKPQSGEAQTAQPRENAPKEQGARKNNRRRRYNNNKPKAKTGEGNKQQ